MILLTGGAGFIGSVLLRELNLKGREDIIVVDRLRESDKWKYLARTKYAEYIYADELFLPENQDLLESVSFIFHIGACSSTTERDVDFLMKNNVEYSKNLFHLATQLNVPLIYASSAATYGDGELGYSDDHQLTPKLAPLNPYGYSKQLFDEWVLKQKETPPRWYGLKFFNVFGPNEYHKGEMRSLVHKAHGQILKEGKVKLFKSHRPDFKDGEQLRDFIYVKDVVKAMMALMDAKGGNGIYNMGTGQARSFFDLVSATFSAMDKKSNIEFIDMPESIRSQYQYYTKAEMNKFLKLIPGFKFTSLEEAVGDYVKNYLSKDNPEY
jgi:ADP-L-glycero-D-manno-heptose 6-epimerase